MKKNGWTVFLVVCAFVSGTAAGRISILRDNTFIDTGDVSAPALSQPLLTVPQTAPDKQDILININTADLDLLCALPGIGPAIGGRIIEYRTQYGDFKDIEEIRAVQGIGDALFASIRPYIFVE